MSVIPTRSTPALRVKRKAAKSAGSVRVDGPPAAAEKAGGLDMSQLPEFVGYSLRRAQIAVFEDFMRSVGQTDLRPGQFSTLLIVDANNGAKQSEVAAALGIQNTNFVALINHLEKRALLERRALDRRSYGLHITRQGKELLQRALELQDAMEKSYEEILGPGGRQLLLGLLARLTAGLEERHQDSTR